MTHPRRMSSVISTCSSEGDSGGKRRRTVTGVPVPRFGRGESSTFWAASVPRRAYAKK